MKIYYNLRKQFKKNNFKELSMTTTSGSATAAPKVPFTPENPATAAALSPAESTGKLPNSNGIRVTIITDSTATQTASCHTTDNPPSASQKTAQTFQNIHCEKEAPLPPDELTHIVVSFNEACGSMPTGG